MSSVDILAEDGLPATLSERERHILGMAYDLSDWPSTGRWEVKKNAHKIGHGMVIEVNPAGVGGKVCDYNFTVHGEWIAAVDPATVAAMLRELAVLRTLTNGIING